MRPFAVSTAATNCHCDLTAGKRLNELSVRLSSADIRRAIRQTARAARVIAGTLCSIDSSATGRLIRPDNGSVYRH